MSQTAFALLKLPSMRAFLGARFFLSFSSQIITFTAGLHVYKLTKDPSSIGFVGIAEFLPILLFSILAGVRADRKNRKRQALIAQLGMITSCGIILLATVFSLHLSIIYLGLVGVGLSRAFNDPAFNSLPPGFLPLEHLAKSSTLSAATWQTAAISGPVLSGIVIAASGSFVWAYAMAIVAALLAFFFVSLIKITIPYKLSDSRVFQSIKEGIGFVVKNKLILSVITLDLFAVLLGSVTALIPVYAYTVFQVGEDGASLMRISIFAGALLMSLLLSARKKFKRAGLSLLISVAFFGIFNILFAFCDNFSLALLILAITGALDGVSVVIRTTIMQVFVPHHLRGRVASINTLFISASNELGDAESGFVASAMGHTGAVVLGGILSVGVVGFVALKWPVVRQLKDLSKTQQ